MYKNVSGIGNVLELLIYVGYIPFIFFLRTRHLGPFISRDEIKKPNIYNDDLTKLLLNVGGCKQLQHKQKDGCYYLLMS